MTIKRHDRLSAVIAEVDAWLAKDVSSEEIEEILNKVDSESEALRKMWMIESEILEAPVTI